MKLKRCPKCGSDRIYIKYNKNHISLGKIAWVACDDCGYDIDPVSGDKKKKIIKEAIREWNWS